mgnify:CR=1 FL=1
MLRPASWSSFPEISSRSGDRWPSQNGEWNGSLVTSTINIGGISDLTFLDDFGNSISRIGRTHITREFKLDRTDYSKLGYLKSSVRATDYQLVKTDLQEQYSVLPQARVEYSSYEKNNSFNYKFNGELSVFDHTYTTKATGTRLTLYPSVEYHVKNIGWEIKQRFFHLTVLSKVSKKVSKRKQVSKKVSKNVSKIQKISKQVSKSETRK